MSARISSGDAALAVFAGLYSAAHGLVAGVLAWAVVALLGLGSATWVAVPCALAAAGVAAFKVIRLVRDEYRAIVQAAFEASAIVATSIIPLWRDSHCTETLETIVHNGIRERIAETTKRHGFRVVDLEDELPERRRLPHE